MSPRVERLLLQLVAGIACLVPLTIGALGVAGGPAFLKGAPHPAPADLDSHFRYLSGVFLGVGIGFASCLPRIEATGARFRLLGAFVILGGLARLGSVAAVGWPGGGHRFGLAMELGVMPLLLLWQMRVAKQAVVADAAMR